MLSTPLMTVLPVIVVILSALPVLAGEPPAQPVAASMLGIFTDRCRTVFAPGEEVEISVVAKAADALDGEIALSLSGPGVDVILARKRVKLAPGSSATFSWRVRPDVTALLKPGGYALSAKLAALQARPFPIEIADLTKKTNFVIYEANWSGTRDYGKTTGGVPNVVKCHADAGHNLAMDLNNVWGNVYEPLKNPFNVADADRAAVPEEWLRDRDFMDLASEELLRNGMGRVVQVHGVWCRTLRLGLEQNERDYLHTYVTAVQAWKRFPNFLGLSYGDDLNTLGDWESGAPESPQADPLFQDRMKWFIADFAQKNPELNVSRGNLLPTNEEIWRAWTDYITGRFVESSSRWDAALRRQMPNFVSTHTDGIMYVQKLSAGNYAPKMNRRMTVVQTKTEADIGTGAFQAELCGEVLTVGRDPAQPAWLGTWGRFSEGTTTIIQRTVSMLGRKMEGLGPFSLGDFDMLAKNDGPDANHFTLGRRERNKIAGEIITRYGDMCLALKADNDVAILYSYSQAMFDVNLASWKSIFRTSEFNFNPHTAYLNQAMVANQAFVDIWRAGFLPKMVAEEDLLADRLIGYQALVLVGITHPLPEPVMAKIAAFQKAGGRVLVDDQTSIDVPGAAKLGVSFNQPGYQAWKQMIKSFRAPVAESQTPHQLVYKYGEPNWPVIREKLSFIKPLATRDNPRVLVSQQSWGKAKYLFVTHDTPPDNWDPAKFWLPNSQWIVPIQTELRLQPGEYAVYDLLAMKQVETKPDGGTRVLPVDLRDTQGRIFAMLPAAISDIRITAPDSVAAGSRVPVEVHVLDAAGKPIDAAGAVAIAVTGADDRVIYRCAAGADGCRAEIAFGINEQPGQYSIFATELFSGFYSRKQIEVRKAELAVRRNAVLEVPDVAVFNLDAIRQLLAKGTEVNIALDDGQDDYKGLADVLAESLNKRGVKCTVMKLADALIPHPDDVKYKGRAERYYTGDLPDAACNLILISGARPNRQLQSLHRHGFCSRAITANYPGPGRAMIDYHWSPFTGGFDAISLASADDAGLAKAIEQFERIVEGKISRPVAEMQTLAKNLEAVRTAMLPPKVARTAVQPTFAMPARRGGLRESSSGSPARRGEPPVVPIDARLGDTVMSLAVSPNGKFIAAGTNSFGDSVFLLNDSGKVLWSGKVGPIYVDRAAVADDGTVIAASLADGSVQVFAPDGKLGKRFDVPPVYPNNGGNSCYDPFAFAAGNVILNQRDRLEAFELDGTKAWEYNTPAQAWTLAESSAGTALTVGCWDDAIIVRLDAATGQEIARTPGVVADSLWVAPDSSHTVACGKAELTVLDAKLQPIHRGKSRHVKAVTNGKVILAASAQGRTAGMTFDTSITVIDMASGKTSSIPMGDVIGGFALGDDGRFYAYSWDGRVIRCDSTGRAARGWEEYGPGGQIVRMPRGGVILGTDNGKIIRLEKTGGWAWSTPLPLE